MNWYRDFWKNEWKEGFAPNYNPYKKFMTNHELIQLHVKGTIFCSFQNHMRSASPTYKEIMAKGNEIIPDILKYLRDNDAGMNVMLLLWDITEISPYQPETKSGFAMFGVEEAKQAWLKWGKKNKLI